MQICPVGALTAKPFRFKARPWDLEVVESTCTTCSVGCRITVDSSRDQILRYQGVDDDPVNWGWMCDRGRFNFEAVGSEDRLGAPLVRKPGAEGDELVEASWAEAIDAAAAAIREALDAGGPSSVAVLGGARGTNEDAYAWVKLAKGIIGTDNVDAQLGDGLAPEAVFGLPPATIDEVCAAGHRGAARARPQRGTARPLPPVARRRRAPRHPHPGAVRARDRPDALRLAARCGTVPVSRRRWCGRSPAAGRRAGWASTTIS